MALKGGVEEGRGWRTHGRRGEKSRRQAERRTRARVMYCSHLRQALRASSAILRWHTAEHQRVHARMYSTPPPPCVSVHSRTRANRRRACVHGRMQRVESRYARLKRSGSLSVHRCTYHIQAIEGESHLLALLCGTTLPFTFAPFDFLTRGKLVDRF